MNIPSPYEAVFAVLQDVKEHTGYWSARCPAHDDQHPSLSLRLGDKALMVKCHAGCSWGGISAAFASLGVPATAFFADGGSTRASRIVESYVYRDIDGRPLYRTLRLEPKSFIQQRFDGKQFVTGLGDVRRVLLHLPELMKEPKRCVWLVEGERKAVSLKKCGLLATTAACGAKSAWEPAFTNWLAGRSVVILPDNDDAGFQRAQTVAEFLEPLCWVVKILELPGLPPKGDVFDWLVANRWSRAAKQELPKLAARAPSFARWQALRIWQAASQAVQDQLAAISQERVRGAA